MSSYSSSSQLPAAPLPVYSQPISTPSPPSSLWERITTWAGENKAVVYTVAGIAVVVSGGAVAYYYTDSNPSSESKKLPKKRKKTSVKKTPDVEKAEGSASTESETKLQAESKSEPKPLTKGPVDELPEVGEAEIAALSSDEREEYAGKLKAAGNQAYGAKEYDRAITLYGKAILCKPDPIFYSNRAACYNAKGEFDLVIQDTTAALAMDNEYVKALNRRAKAYEHTEQYSEALLDFTASCIIDGFNNEASTQSVERLLKKVAEKKGREILATKVKKLPSPTFVSNYLQSFRVKERPTGLEDAAELSEESGLGQLRYGLKSMETKTGQGYEDAAIAFNKAIELGELGGHEAYAYNMRGTFRYLQGDNEEALADLTKSIELEPSLIQSYIKRASMHLELGHQADAAKDFEAAEKQDSKDPDIYYHRAQLHFILGEFPDASRDYQKSIDLDPDFIFSHIQLGVTQYKMGSIASSMATFRRTIKNFVTAGDVYNYYGELLLDQQKHEEAISKFDTAIEMEQKNKPSGSGMNVLPLINKALALFQWKQDYAEAEKLCEKALIIDPECDIAVATMAQLLLQQGKVIEALKYFERAAELSRTEGEIVNALSYAEATRTQLEVQEKYPSLANRLQKMGGGPMSSMA